MARPLRIAPGTSGPLSARSGVQGHDQDAHRLYGAHQARGLAPATVYQIHACLSSMGKVGWQASCSYTGGAMTKLTIELDEGVAKRVAELAADRGVAPETLAAEAVAEKFPPRRKLGFVSLGRSTSGQRASEDEDMLAEGLGR